MKYAETTTTVPFGTDRLSESAAYALFVLWAALPVAPALVEISFVVALLLWSLAKIRSRFFEAWILSKKTTIPLLAFLGLSALSVLWSESLGVSLRGILKILQQVMIFWMTADLLSSKVWLKRFETLFLIVLFVICLDGIAQYFLGFDLLRGFGAEDSSSGLRVSASFKSYGLFGSYLVSVIPFLGAITIVSFKENQPLGKRGAWLALAAVSILLLLLTRSRGCLLAFLAGTAFFLILKGYWRMLLVAGLLVVVLFLSLPKGMIIHLDGEGKEQSLVERFYLWDRALNVIKAKPLTGTGINTYTSSHEKYDLTQNWRVRGYYAHNGYLQLAAETGLPSLIFFLWFLGVYFLRSIRLNRLRAKSNGLAVIERSAGLLAGAFGFLVLVTIDTVLHNNQAVTVFWYLLGVQLAYQGSEPVQ